MALSQMVLHMGHIGQHLHAHSVKFLGDTAKKNRRF